MDIVERLTLEAAREDTALAGGSRHRYEFASTLCRGRRVLDLCCGSGYGSAILAAHAREVVGVDVDAAAVETATVTAARAAANVSFELADAVTYLRRDIPARFDVVVCLAGLEYLAQLDLALSLLHGHAENGVQVIASLSNGELAGEHSANRRHTFAYDEAMAAFGSFSSVVMVPQYLAEGSMILPAGAPDAEVTVQAGERYEPEFAHDFIFCIGMAEADLERARRGRLQVSAEPASNRETEDLKREVVALRRENARLGRARLGKAGSAAAATLSRLADSESQITSLRHRCHVAETRIAELSEELAGATASPEKPVPRERVATKAVEAVQAQPLQIPPGEDPNTWEQRRRRAAGHLIPWIEQTVPLAGKTVLEYGCGNAAVSCAVAQRAGTVIGLDIDPGGIELGNQELSARGVQNVQLELHRPESVLEAVASRRGQIDVLLLYAVLEHLTVSERLGILRLAREVLRPDGAIVVCETPNRLIYFDHHTARMPFFHMLPDELALDYTPRSDREDFKAAIDAAADNGREAALEAIARWGRGVSFHEFELVFDDLSQHVLASSYDPLLFGERPIHPDEVMLARYLDHRRPDLAPCWSRYWLDLILSPQPLASRPAFLRPWTADTTESRNVGWTRWENMLLKGPDSTLSVNLPHPSSKLVVGTVTQDGHWLSLYAQAEEGETILARHKAAAGHTAFSTLEFTQPFQRVALEATEECHVVFVGFED
jgi:2-polyprenyl-3-methyl-5-hydroxy-6-metoxy-1,4-benzoquinol methylase